MWLFSKGTDSQTFVIFLLHHHHTCDIVLFYLVNVSKLLCYECLCCQNTMYKAMQNKRKVPSNLTYFKWLSYSVYRDSFVQSNALQSRLKLAPYLALICAFHYCEPKFPCLKNYKIFAFAIGILLENNCTENILVSQLTVYTCPMLEDWSIFHPCHMGYTLISIRGSYVHTYRVLYIATW